VKITTTGTDVSRQLATKASGSLEAPLLIPGDDKGLLEIRTSGAFGRTAFS
jgi:hypothetical protein